MSAEWPGTQIHARRCGDGIVPENPQKRKAPKKGGAARGDGLAGVRAGAAEVTAEPVALVVETGGMTTPINEGSVLPTPEVEPLDPVQKKVRNLDKKVRDSPDEAREGAHSFAFLA